MKYEQVKQWVRNNYPDIPVYDDIDNEGETLELFAGEVTITFLGQGEPSGHCIRNNETDEFALVVSTYEDNCKNVACLLHELGHATEPQRSLGGIHSEKDVKLFNEMRAWEGAKKFTDKLGITLHMDFSCAMFSTYVNYYGRNFKVMKWMLNFGMISLDEFEKFYCVSPKNRPFDWKEEAWRK